MLSVLEIQEIQWECNWPVRAVSEWGLESLPALLGGGILEGEGYGAKCKGPGSTLTQWQWHRSPSPLVSEGRSFLPRQRLNKEPLHPEDRMLDCGIAWELGHAGAKGSHGMGELASGADSLHPRQLQKICFTTTSLKFLWFPAYLSVQGESDDCCGPIKHFSEGVKAPHSLRLMCF